MGRGSARGAAEADPRLGWRRREMSAPLAPLPQHPHARARAQLACHAAPPRGVACPGLLPTPLPNSLFFLASALLRERRPSGSRRLPAGLSRVSYRRSHRRAKVAHTMPRLEAARGDLTHALVAAAAAAGAVQADAVRPRLPRLARRVSSLQLVEELLQRYRLLLLAVLVQHAKSAVAADGRHLAAVPARDVGEVDHHRRALECVGSGERPARPRLLRGGRQRRCRLDLAGAVPRRDEPAEVSACHDLIADGEGSAAVATSRLLRPRARVGRRLRRLPRSSGPRQAPPLASLQPHGRGPHARSPDGLRHARPGVEGGQEAPWGAALPHLACATLPRLAGCGLPRLAGVALPRLAGLRRLAGCGLQLGRFRVAKDNLGITPASQGAV
mmetsp:Transcript_39018/g.126138  ORF Transcript_39018/g.126138 Transcript_39018/m.126138 type:complete len:386 (+) Transcript_39018:188-1345(+)